MSLSRATLDFTVSDPSRQKVTTVEGVSPDYTAAELVQGLLEELRMPTHDAEGRSFTYNALLRRESRHLSANERIGDAVKSGDWLVLQPNVDAA